MSNSDQDGIKINMIEKELIRYPEKVDKSSTEQVCPSYGPVVNQTLSPISK